jgi:DNA polymerase III epsilon subunit-like protein
MKILFLDTETSGLDPKNSQIIEIAGVLVDFDEISLEIKIESHFESLVAYRGVGRLDDKITRLTGITHEELLPAESLTKVQQKWLDWLTGCVGQSKVVAIIGHSIAFDIGFLKSEGWFLPDEMLLKMDVEVQNLEGVPKIIDTLSLAKILCPEQEAVNLEYLTESLDLELADEFKSKSYHRSLYDTGACVELFRYLILKLNQIQISEVFTRVLIKHFLPLPLQIYHTKSFVPADFNFDLSDNLVEINIDGVAKPITLTQKLQKLGEPVHIRFFEKLLQDLEHFDLPENIWQVSLQLYKLAICNNRNYKNFGSKGLEQVKFHSKSRAELLIGEVVVESVLGQSLERKQAGYILPRIESVIWKMRSLMEVEIPLADLVEFIGLIWKIVEKNYKPLGLNPEIAKQCQMLVNNFDFFLYNLQNLLDYGEYTYDASALSPKERDVYTRLQNLSQSLEQTMEEVSKIAQEKNSYNQISDFKIFNHLIFKTQEVWQKCKIKADSKYTFKFVGGQFYMNLVKENVNLANYFEKLLVDYPELLVETYLSQNDIQKLGKMAKMPASLYDRAVFIGVKKGEPNSVHMQIDRQNIGEFLENCLQKAMENQRPVVLFCGLNSTLNEATKELTENFKKSDYLLFGDTGSITKVMGKLVRGFCGVCVLRIQNTETLIRLAKRPQILESWIVNEPYFPIHTNWIKLAKESGNQEEFLKDLKEIHLHSHLNYLAKSLDCPSNFLVSWR